MRPHIDVLHVVAREEPGDGQPRAFEDKSPAKVINKIKLGRRGKPKHLLLNRLPQLTYPSGTFLSRPYRENVPLRFVSYGRVQCHPRSES